MKRNSQTKSTFIIGSVALVSLLLSGMATMFRLQSSTTPPQADAATITPVGQSGSWDLIFSDEFDQNQLDLSKWEPSWFAGNSISKPINTDEDGCYDPAQVSVSDGKLNLAAIQTNKPECVTRSGAQAQYASGLVNTRKSFTFAYGYMEARMYLPGENGQIWNWPAFWSDGTGDWPKTGEIDVMEGLSNHRPCWHYHYQDSSGNHQGPGGCADHLDGTGWHTYAAKWEPGKITYYYDGLKVGEISDGVVSAEHFIILNNGINDRYGIHVPATVQVDYVRVWKPGSTQPTPSITPTPVSPRPKSSVVPSPLPSQQPTPTPWARPSNPPPPQPSQRPAPTQSPSPTPAPQAEGIQIQSLQLQPARNQYNPWQSIRAQAVVRSAQPTRVEALTIAVRNTRNRNYDFRGAVTNVVIGPQGYTFTPRSRRFFPGEYVAFVAYKRNGRWYNLSPQVTFTVR